MTPPSSGERTRPSLIFQVTVAAPVADVFDAFFRTPERWLCRAAGIEPRTGGALRLEFPDGAVAGRFVQFEAPSTGRFSWRMDGDPLPETMVVVWVTPGERDGRSVAQVEVEHYGFGAGPEWEWSYLGATRAWAGYLKNLRSVLEGGLDLREAEE